LISSSSQGEAVTELVSGKSFPVGKFAKKQSEV